MVSTYNQGNPIKIINLKSHQRADIDIDQNNLNEIVQNMPTKLTRNFKGFRSPTSLASVQTPHRKFD